MVNNLLWLVGVGKALEEGKKNIEINRYNRYQSIYLYRKSILIEDWYRLLTIVIDDWFIDWLRLDYLKAIKADLAAQAIAHFIILSLCYSILCLFLWIFIILGGTHVRPGMQVVKPLKLKLCHVTMVFIHWYECFFFSWMTWVPCAVCCLIWHHLRLNYRLFVFCCQELVKHKAKVSRQTTNGSQ